MSCKKNYTCVCYYQGREGSTDNIRTITKTKAQKDCERIQKEASWDLCELE